MAKSDKEDFETLLKRLEEIVGKMDAGGLSLEECMKLYEEGVRKSDRLTAMLGEARDRVMKLVTDKNGNASLESFAQENES
ncbi:MAG: exodeoxyribonuclease VII small subunit [Candidatus Latescibacterota bacterium]